MIYRANQIGCIAKLSPGHLRTNPGNPYLVQNNMEMSGNIFHKILTLADSTANHEKLRVKAVLDIVHRPCQLAIHVLNRLLGNLIPIGLQLKDLLAVQGILVHALGQCHMLCQGTGGGSLTEHRALVIHHHKTELAPMQMATMVHAPSLDNGTAYAAADYQEHHILAVLGSSQPNLAQSRTVGIILHGHRQPQLFLQGLLYIKIMNVRQGTGTANHPDLIINVGVAGCFEEVPIGTLVLAEDFIQHDVDTTGVGDPIGLVSTVNKVSFPTADFTRAKAAMDKTGFPYRTGRVATGDWFALPSERVNVIRDTFSPLLCEMEGGAVAQVCYRCGVPMMAIKSVSDCLVVKQDYYFNFPMAMADLNGAVMVFVDALKEV